MGSFVGSNGYYEGDRQGFDTEVPKRPTVNHVWIDGAWELGPQQIPTVVTMRQARLALMSEGMLDDVSATISGLPSPQKEAAQIEWEYSQEVHRDRPFVQQLTAVMGLTPQQVDDLFMLAASL